MLWYKAFWVSTCNRTDFIREHQDDEMDFLDIKTELTALKRPLKYLYIKTTFKFNFYLWCRSCNASSVWFENRNHEKRV